MKINEVLECKGLIVHHPGGNEPAAVIYMPYGKVIIGDHISKNGIRVISTVEGGDPAEVVLETQYGGGLGKISMARHRSDGNREETVLWQGKIDERYRSIEEGGIASFTQLVGESRLDLRVPSGGDEGGMQPAYQVLTDGHVSHVPFKGQSAPGGAAAPIRVTRFYTDHGEFCFNMQDDGEGMPTGIVYDTHGSADEKTWTAVGRITVSPL